MKKTMMLVSLVLAILLPTLAQAKVPVCVNAYQLQTKDADGFLIEGVVEAQKELDASAKDMVKQVKKSKVMEYVDGCDIDTLQLTVIYRGWKKSGDLDVFYNHIGQYLSVTEVSYRSLVVMLQP
jgi:hypothetical protein